MRIWNDNVPTDFVLVLCLCVAPNMVCEFICFLFTRNTFYQDHHCQPYDCSVHHMESVAFYFITQRPTAAEPITNKRLDSCQQQQLEHEKFHIWIQHTPVSSDHSGNVLFTPNVRERTEWEEVIDTAFIGLVSHSLRILNPTIDAN